MPCYSLVSGKPDFLKFEDVLDELFEHHHSAPVADILGMHGEHKESSFFIGFFEISPEIISCLFVLFGMADNSHIENAFFFAVNLKKRIDFLIIESSNWACA